MYIVQTVSITHHCLKAESLKCLSLWEWYDVLEWTFQGPRMGSEPLIAQVSLKGQSPAMTFQWLPPTQSYIISYDSLWSHSFKANFRQVFLLEIFSKKVFVVILFIGGLQKCNAVITSNQITNKFLLFLNTQSTFKFACLVSEVLFKLVCLIQDPNKFPMLHLVVS